MKFQETHALKAYREHRDAIPPVKWAKKVGRFLGGIAVAGIVTLGAIRFGVGPIPWWAYALGYGIAGYLISPDVMQGIKKFLVGLIKDMREALKNGSP